MATGATGQLGLALPVQGDLSGTWGNTVNNGITEYTNIAIAATLTLTGDGAVTLANTTGDASASNITSTLAGAGTVTAQFSTVRVSGTTVAKTVTGPSYSKSYLIDNASSFSVTFKAAGQTGVSISPNEKVYVYFNATDYVKVGGGGITYGAVKTTTYTAVANDGVLTNTTGGAFTVNLPATPATGTQVFIADSAGTWGTNNLTIGRNGSTIAGSATDLVCDINSVSIQCIYDGTTWDIFAQIGANDTAVVTLNGTQTLTNKTLTSPILTTPTLGVATATSLQGIIGNVTPAAGVFTTLSSTDFTDSSLTATRIVYAGTGGNLTGNASFSFDETNFVLDGSTKVQILGSGAKLQMQTPTASANWYLETSGTNLTVSSAQSGQFNIYRGSANSTFGVGAADPSSSGAGITFPASQSASSNAHTLDDYEEGVWTPTVVGGYTGVTYSSQNGWYTKVGRSVVISGRVQFSGTANAAGISVGGLPFSQGNLGGGAYGGGGIPYTTVTVVTNASPYCSGNTVEYYTMGTGGQIASSGNVSGVWLSFVISISTD